MLRRALILFSLTAFALLAAALYIYVAPHPTDFEEYQRLKMEGTSSLREKRPVLQKRLGVKKEFWIPEEDSRNHLSISSVASELLLSDRHGKIEATEVLQELTGSMEEEGCVRCFTAQNGTYYYPTQRFFAHHAKLSLTQKPDTVPLFWGTAEEIHVSFLGKKTIHAEQVEFHSGDSFRALGEKASFNALGKEMGVLEITPSCRMEFEDAFLQCVGPLTLDLQENLAETHLPFHYEESQIKIDANGGRLLYGRDAGGKLKPQMIQCEGAVRMLAQGNYALADQLVYFPETGMLHLLSENPSRVLFWKSDGSIQISAPEVRARFDGKESREEIKGIGDVHFTFDLEEEHRIETLFGKYL